jgi:hypothetical protein
VLLTPIGRRSLGFLTTSSDRIKDQGALAPTLYHSKIRQGAVSRAGFRAPGLTESVVSPR